LLTLRLDLLLLDTVLPDGHKWRDTVLTVVEQHNPTAHVSTHTSRGHDRSHLHSVGVHGLADKELVVLEVGNDLLRVSLRTRLELLDRLVAGAVGLHSLLDLLHVRLQVGEVRLLVELGLVQSERVDDIDDLLRRIFGGLLTLLSGRVAANVEALASDGDLLAVGLVDGAVDFLEVVRVGDQLIAGDDVLRLGQSRRTSARYHRMSWQSPDSYYVGSACRRTFKIIMMAVLEVGVVSERCLGLMSKKNAGL